MNSEYKGMTVNERLYASGLINAFDKAIEDKDLSKIIDILKKIGIEDNSLVNPILKHFNLKQ